MRFPTSPFEIYPQHHTSEFCLTHKSKLSYTHFLGIILTPQTGSSYQFINLTMVDYQETAHLRNGMLAERKHPGTAQRQGPF
jgi:hypothetical protein